MKYQLLRLALAVTLLLPCAWPRTSPAQAAIAYGVVAWGYNEYGQTTVPVGAQSGVTAIAAGYGHTVALKNDGSVVAWGYNGYGQTTVPVAAQSGVTAIAAGGLHTVALKNDGSVVAWGRNDYGQRTVPVTAQSGVTAVAAGDLHTVALKNDGSVVAWGSDGAGQTDVPISAQSGVTAIAAGRWHIVALKNDGSVVAWGYNDGGQVTGTPTTDDPYSAIASPVRLEGQVLSGVTAIAAGGIHTVALVIPTAPNITTQPVGQAVNAWQSASFTVVATGYLLNYQWREDGVDLAGATNATYSLAFAHTNHAGHYTVVVSNSVGSVTSAPPAVLTVSAAPGTVVAWGGNDSGETAVPVAAQSGVTAIAAGGLCGMGWCGVHTVALKNDGTVVAWGSNGSGQVTGTPTTDGDGYPYSATASPVTLGGKILSGVTAIAAGTDHTVALKNDGTVVAWGYNGSGGTTVPVAAQSGVTAIAAGSSHTVALKNDGTVVAWGNNESGQTTIPLAAQSGVTAIAAGSGHTVALKNDGSVVAWGNNYHGASTVPVAAQSGVTAIAAGGSHTVALKNDGTVVAWGSLDQTTVPVAAQSGVSAIAAGGDHTVALKNDGTVVAWGYNYYGAVTGTPTTDTNYAIASPVTLEGQVLSGVTAIAAGGGRTVALIGGVELLPSLKARPNGNELILSWPTNAVGFTLQSTLDLKPPVTWLDSTNLPAVIGAHFTLTNTTSGGARFYRLRKM